MALPALIDTAQAYLMADEETVVEMVPQIPGQFGLDGGEQEAAPHLKLIKTS